MHDKVKVKREHFKEWSLICVKMLKIGGKKKVVNEARTKAFEGLC